MKQNGPNVNDSAKAKDGQRRDRLSFYHLVLKEYAIMLHFDPFYE